jgi:hypothetical protein
MDRKGPSKEAIRSLTYIGALTDKRQELELGIAYHVAEAREQGASWRMIAVSLGTSTQAAWDRYSGHQRDSEIQGQTVLWACPESE